MIESQHAMWAQRFRLFVEFLFEQDVMDYGQRFAEQRQAVKQVCELCSSFATFDTHCTRSNLRILCDFTKRIVGSGAANHFADWTYIVTHLHLFVVEAECRKWQQGDGSSQAMCVDGVHPHEHLQDTVQLEDMREHLLSL